MKRHCRSSFYSGHTAPNNDQLATRGPSPLQQLLHIVYSLHFRAVDNPISDPSQTRYIGEVSFGKVSRRDHQIVELLRFHLRPVALNAICIYAVSQLASPVDGIQHHLDDK